MTWWQIVLVSLLGAGLVVGLYFVFRKNTFGRRR